MNNCAILQNMQAFLTRKEEIQHLRFEEKRTLQYIADKYNISRERVRQILGNSGRTFVTDRRKQIHNLHQQATNDDLAELMGVSTPAIFRYRNGERHGIKGGSLNIGTAGEIIVAEKLTSLCIANSLMPHHHPFDILLESGLRIDVKSSNPSSTSKTIKPLYNFHAHKTQKGPYCDFLILFLLDATEYFVVPLDNAEDTIRFCWPPGKKVSKFQKFYNRFDLLIKTS